jgi:hypothetical protein
MKTWTTTQQVCPFCGLESTHSKNCRWVMTLEQLFRSVRNNRNEYIKMGHHPEGDTLRCLSDLLEMHPFDGQSEVFKDPAPMPSPKIVGEIFAKDDPAPSVEAAAIQALGALRYVRDFEPEKWDALMATEAGVILARCWDALKHSTEAKNPNR